jgi:hypothetical protein
MSLSDGEREKSRPRRAPPTPQRDSVAREGAPARSGARKSRCDAAQWRRRPFACKRTAAISQQPAQKWRNIRDTAVAGLPPGSQLAKY